MQQLATRCSHCGTSFRVSEAQLAISEGYVRCGRCDAVFNARDALFDLEGGSPSQPMPLAPATAPAPLETDRPIGSRAEAPAPQPAPEPAFAEEDDAGFPATEDLRTEPQWDPAPAAEQDTLPRHPTDVEAPVDPNRQLRSLLGMQPVADEAVAAPAPWSSLAGKASAPATARSAWLLPLGGLLVAMLVLALPLQWAWIEREAFRARSPQLDQWLRQTVPSLPSDGLRQVDLLSVASSSLLATPQGGAYQLDLTLHNRGSQPLATPWIDLRLSDAQGKLLVRKSLSPAELGQGTPLRAGEQRRVQAVFRLKTTGPAISGYEVGLFHP